MALRTKQIKEFKFTPWSDEDWKLLQYDNSTGKYIHVDPSTLSWSTTAADTTYDNTTSWLTATDVQAAIDEVEWRTDTLEWTVGNVWTKTVDEWAIADWYILKYNSTSWNLEYNAVAEWTAATTSVDTTNFNSNLSSADDTVQKALDTIDELVTWWAALSDTYTTSNIVTTRTLDADNVSLDELADVVWTVVEDMKVNNVVDTISIPDYTPTNVTETRTFDADSTSISELADVLWTLVSTDLNQWLKWPKWDDWADWEWLTWTKETYTETWTSTNRDISDSSTLTDVINILWTLLWDLRNRWVIN